MNLFRFVWLDVKNGIVREWRLYLVAALIFVLFCLSIYVSSASYNASYDLENLPLTLGDYLVYLVAGMKEYYFDPSNPFSFPAAWMLLFLLMAYLTLNYPYRDLMGIGKHLMVLSGSRVHWWASKCAWVVLSVAAFFLLSFVVLLVWTIATGGALTFAVSETIPDLLNFDVSLLVPQPWNIIGLFVVIPLVTIALCLVQLLLSLFIRPMFSYIVIIGILFFSAYFQTPWLIGSYLMAARSDCFVMGGMNGMQGIVIALVSCACVIIFGGALFRRMDIIDWEQQ